VEVGWCGVTSTARGSRALSLSSEDEGDGGGRRGTRARGLGPEEEGGKRGGLRKERGEAGRREMAQVRGEGGFSFLFFFLTLFLFYVKNVLEIFGSNPNFKLVLKWNI
jgi:hypothetical protein